MADTLKVLGQIALASAGAEQQLYKVPAATSTTISSIVVANRGSTDRTFVIGIDVGDDNGAGSETKDFLYKDVTVLANDTFIATVGLTLAATDSLNVTGSHTDLTFSAFGVEVT